MISDLDVLVLAYSHTAVLMIRECDLLVFDLELLGVFGELDDVLSEQLTAGRPALYGVKSELVLVDELLQHHHIRQHVAW